MNTTRCCSRSARMRARVTVAVTRSSSSTTSTSSGAGSAAGAGTQSPYSRGMATARPLRETQQFFAERAATWDERFPDDGPAYARAAADLAPPVGGTLLDLGCGTARALRPLRAQLGPEGVVIALDATWEMLRAASEAGRQQFGDLVAADALSLPLPDQCL